jgi:hypothetical protein
MTEKERSADSLPDIDRFGRWLTAQFYFGSTHARNWWRLQARDGAER